MKSLKFTSVIEIRDGNPYIHISPEQAKEIKPGRFMARSWKDGV